MSFFRESSSARKAMELCGDLLKLRGSSLSLEPSLMLNIADKLEESKIEINHSLKDMKDEDKKSKLEIILKYSAGNPVISSIERVSKPGRRIFSSANSLPKINNGLGIAIVSTPKGVMTDVDARKQNIGGEIICKVF